MCVFVGVCNPPAKFWPKQGEKRVRGLGSGSEGPGVWETGIGETEGWQQLPERPTVLRSVSVCPYKQV